MPRILGLDYGDRRLGFALSDPTATLAFPHGVVTLDHPEQAVNEIVRICRETGAARLVVGYPLNMDGSRGPRAELTDALIAKLAQRLAIPVEKWDERMSTQTAEQAMIEAGARRARRRAVVDKLAAQIMLQHYLDCRPPPGPE